MVKKKTEKDEPKFVIKKRTPKEKPNYFQNLTPFKHPVAEIFEQAKITPSAAVEEPIQPNLSNPIQSHDSPSNDTPSHPTLSHPIPYKPVAAEKDYQKVPNSISRDAIPQKLFKGTSKNTYDALFLRTRGAIKPTRAIKATKKELMKWIGISHVTIFKHLTHLESIGLISIQHELGSHTGSVYEVFIPEEVKLIQPHTTPCNPDLSNDSPSNVIQPQNVVREVSNKLVLDRMGKDEENKDIYEPPKTLFKTNTNDDEAFAGFIEVFQNLSRELHGRELGKKDNPKWAEFALMLAEEIRSAKTTVSDIPAFITEHVRRALASKVPSSRLKVQPDKVGAETSKEFDLEKEVAVLSDLEDWQKWENQYTPEQWKQIVERLK